jgi:catechol 2,3-dioxygenase-like lactoylglutathione lyase family enzyme
VDQRPPVWIGHALLAVRDVGRSAEYWTGLGLREVARGDDFAVLELRGGTHLILAAGDVPADAGAPFDLMVDDLEATHTEWEIRGLDPSPVEHGDIHSRFSVRDPDGYLVTVNSSHVVGVV